ncbi:MAG: ABC transporter permease [Clostridia bacterium]|nr:ABC transporter permease [Clostridia bacterium]
MLLHIALKDLKIIFRDRQALAVMLVMPLLIVVILGSALGSSFSPQLAIQRFTVGVVNNDEGLMSQIFINEVLRGKLSDMFSTFVIDEQKAEEMLKSEAAPAVIVIPEGFSESIENGKPVRIDIKAHGDSRLKSGIVRSVTEGFAENLSMGYAGAFATLDTLKKYNIPFNAQANGVSNATAIMGGLQKKLGSEMLKFKEIDQEKQKTISAMSYYSAAMLVMFLLFGANTGTKLIIEERESRTLGRLISARPGKAALITGKFLGLMLICFTQAVILIIFTQLFYGVNWGVSLTGIALVTLSSAFAAAAFGMFIAAIARTVKVADGLGQLFIQAFTVIGGGMWPIYLMPEPVKIAARFTLNWWAFNGYHDLMMGMNPQTVLPYCGILVLMGLAYLSFGILKFRV